MREQDRSPRRKAAAVVGAVVLMAGSAAVTPGVPGLEVAAQAQVIDAAALSARLGPSVFEVEVDNCSGLPRGTGTAFVIGPRQLITNSHVIGSGAPEVRLTNKDGRAISGTVVAFGIRDWDLAVIETTEDLPPALAFADPAALVEGQPVTVVGYPRGRYSVASGLINSFETAPGATNREIGRTDTAVDSGNSGSPVLTAAGEVAGIVSSVDLSGITRPGRLLTRNAVTAGLTTPDPFPAGWCAPSAPISAARLTAPALRVTTVRRSGYSVRLPVGLLTETGIDDDGDPYWETPNSEVNTVIFTLPSDLTPRQAALDLTEYYDAPGVTFAAPVVGARRMEMVVVLKNGRHRRTSYRWGARRGFGMITNYTPSERTNQVVATMNSSLTVR